MFDFFEKCDCFMFFKIFMKKVIFYFLLLIIKNSLKIYESNKTLLIIITVGINLFICIYINFIGPKIDHPIKLPNSLCSLDNRTVLQ